MIKQQFVLLVPTLRNEHNTTAAIDYITALRQRDGNKEKVWCKINDSVH
jgi:hypothetical protein